MLDYLKALLEREDGASAVEYGLVVAFVGVVVAGALWGFGNEIENFFGNMAGSLPNNPTADSP